MVADYAEVGKVGGCDGAAAVVGEALVALFFAVSGCVKVEGEEENGLPRCCRTSMPS